MAVTNVRMSPDYPSPRTTTDIHYASHYRCRQPRRRNATQKQDVARPRNARDAVRDALTTKQTTVPRPPKARAKR